VPRTNYAVVQGVPASWNVYLPGAQHRQEQMPGGLLLHAAGPTDEGFRVIDVWESQADWRIIETGNRWKHSPAHLRRPQTHTTLRDLKYTTST